MNSIGASSVAFIGCCRVVRAPREIYPRILAGFAKHKGVLALTKEADESEPNGV